MFSSKAFLITIIAAAFFVRVIGIERYPPLYTDEASLGYSAYSILKTAKDEFGVVLPVSLRSFGDYKPALSAYLMIPGIAIFGLSPFTIRLPSVVLGTATVWLVYLLVRMLAKKEQIALAAACVLALSPWHIHQSRMAMLVGPTLFFWVFGIYSCLRGRISPRFFIVSLLSFALAVYGYYGMRLMAPLMLVALSAISLRQLKHNFAWAVLSGMLFGLALLPLGLAFVANPEVVFGRVRHVSVFADDGVRLRLWEAASTDQGIVPLVSRIFHNKPVAYTEDIARRFLSHLELPYLFMHGDRAEPFEIPGIGLLWLIETPFVFIGIRALRIYPMLARLLLIWVVISIFPAALTFVTPASNRSFPIVVPFAIASAAGVMTVLSNQTVVRGAGIGILLFGSIIYGAYQYVLVLPRTIGPRVFIAAPNGAATLSHYLPQYDRVVISERSRLHASFLFVFLRMDPRAVQSQLILRNGLDQFGYEHVDRIGKIEYRQDVLWEQEQIPAVSLYILAPHEGLPRSEYSPKILAEIRYESGDQAMRFVEIQPKGLP